jgi:hypothetical protein
MKTSAYHNAAVTASCFGLLWLLAGCYDMTVSFEATKPETSSTSPSEKNNLSPVSSSVSSETTTLSSAAKPTKPEPQTSEKTADSVLASSPHSVARTGNMGTLRMSNQTTQPVRLALLARKSKVKNSSAGKTGYGLPAHWDFAPQEGSQKGLVLSLPNGNLKLEKGDILVAFAQDGSRRYWGPYVVGETSLPAWNGKNNEWQLVLSQ